MIEKTWNEPKQARSQKRFDHILDVSAQLIARDGYNIVTTNHIAEAADVSIGALYRFFPNKDAILGALIYRYQQRIWKVFPQKLDLSLPYDVVLGELVDNLMQISTQETAFQHVFANVSSELVESMHTALISQVAHLIGAYHPQLTEVRVQLCASVGVSIVRGMMPLTNPPQSFTLDIVAREMKLALLSYLDRFLKYEELQ